jgi:site-specific recombinase XerD
MVSGSVLIIEALLPRMDRSISMTNTSAKPISPLRQRMIEDMKSRNLGSGTQRNHLSVCARFAKWLGRSPETATADDVKAFQVALIEEDGMSICNRNRIMGGVKFLLKVTMRRHDLAAEVHHIKEPQKLPPVLTQQEVKRLLAMSKNTKARAMLSLAYGCGLRAGEVVRLRAGDIDREQGIIRIVQAKGRKDRHVMLPDEIYSLLRQWWKDRPIRHDAGVPAAQRWLFPGRKNGGPLTTRQFGRIFRDTAAAARITKPVTLHCLRHSFATHLLERGTNIRVIQALLGHTKLTTTARYAFVATGMISKVESPLDTLTRPKGKKGKRKVPA